MAGALGADFLLERRGGSSITFDPNDPSSYPTTPPASTQSHFRNIPKIGGSEGGFIGLVVGLGVIFIGSCIGVFLLLRNWRHGGRTARGKSGELGVEPPPLPGFPRRRGTLFGFRSQNPRGAGWVRAAGEDEDEWDANDNLGGPYGAGAGYRRESVQLEQSAYGTGRYEDYGDTKSPLSSPPPTEHTREMPHAAAENGVSSVSSVNLVAPGGVKPAGETFHDPFDAPVRTTSPDQRHDEGRPYPSLPSHITKEQRHMSQDSVSTVTSFPGGTKFREEI